MRATCNSAATASTKTIHHTPNRRSFVNLPNRYNSLRGALGRVPLILLAPLLLSQFALAVPSFESFADATATGGTAYGLGANLVGQKNTALYAPWFPRGTNFGTTQPVIANDNLSYPGLPASSGHSAAFVPANSMSACLDLNLPAGGQPAMVYCSFLLKITSLTGVPTTAANNPFAAFVDDPTAPFYGNQINRLGTRVVTKKVGSGFVLGTSKSATTSDFVYEPDGSAHNVGDVLLVVQGYQRDGTTQTNVNLWINPPSSSFGASTPPAPTLTALTGSTALNNNGARVWGLLCQFANAPSGVVDDVRVSTDWAAVTGGPGLYASPTNQTANAGAAVVFNVGAFGGTPLSYQWQKDGVNLSNGGNIAGATSATLTLSSVFQPDAGSYSVIVTNSYASAASSAAILAVNDPFITTQPTNQTLAPGVTATLRVAAVGTPTLTYQWYTNGVPLANGGRISGATSTTLTINNFSSIDAGTYTVQVFNGLFSSVTSSNAVLSPTDPSISSQPQSVTNIYGTTATFQVTPSGTTPFSYQWHRATVGDLSDGGNISGSHTNILMLSGVSFTDSGTYSVTVTNIKGSVDSAPAVLTVRDPAIVTQPASVTNSAGATVTFHVVAVGTPGLTYQWRKNASIIFDTGNYSGTSTDTLSVSGISAADEGSYSVIVTGGSGGSETSVDATLTVISAAAITAQPTPRKVTAGSQTVLAVGATGSFLQYRWQLGGVDVPGATSYAYILTNVQPPVTGNYRVIVSNALNSETSSVATVSIIPSVRLASTNFVAIRVGDGAQLLTTHGNSMFLDQFGPDGSYASTLNIPDNGPAGILAIGPTVTVTPSSVTGNGLSRSANGRFLVFGGYNTNLSNTAELQSTGAGAISRGIALIDDRAQYTLAIASTSTSSGNFWRGATADGTNNYWGYSRTSSTYYFGFDQPGLVIQSDWSNLRSMNIFNGRIYGVSAVTGKTGVMRFAGLPEVAETVEVVINTGSNFSSDCEVNSAANLVYVADSNVAGAGGGIQRWQFDGSSWSLAYTLSDQLPGGAYYVAADFSGANPVVYAVTTDQDNNRIVRIVDTGAGATGTVVAYAGANQNFRGIRLGPAATTSTTHPTLFETPAAGAVVLNWNGSYILQSATNVTGIYQDVINGTRPYTNSTGSAPQMFFRLRQ